MNSDFVWGLALGGVALAYAAYTMMGNEKDSSKKSPQRRISPDELKNYNGDGPRACFVALDGDIYDVTSKKLKFISAKVAGRSLNKLNKPDELIDEFTALGLSVNEIKTKFPKVGTLLVMKEFTKEELKKFVGTGDLPAYICAKGIVFDVDKNFYGPDAPYGAFAGRDASRALAKMSLEKEDLENTSLDDLNWSEKQALEEWVAKFETKYTRVGYLKK